MTHQMKDHVGLSPLQRRALASLSRATRPLFVGEIVTSHIVIKALVKRGLVAEGPEAIHHQARGRTWVITDAGRELLAVPAPSIVGAP